MTEDIIRKLSAPFPFSEVEAKIQVTMQDKSKGMAVFYIDSRAIQKRLDETLGAMNWKNQYVAWQDKAQLCGIAIFNAERGEWVGKFDGAECSDIEPIKGGLSDSFKRAACVWGIGRYLYQIDGVWVEIEQRGKGYYIKDNQQGKLEAEYNKAVARIFGAAAESIHPADETNKPASATPPVSQKPKETKSPKTAPQPSPDTQVQPMNPPRFEYQVRAIKPSGKQSSLVELVGSNGELTQAYIRNSDKPIKVGSHLRKTTLEKKDGAYGAYHLLTSYEIAA